MFGKKNDEKISEIYCAVCNNKSGFAGYAPKKEWNITGKLCSKCFAKMLGEYGRKVNVKETSEMQDEDPSPGRVFTNNVEDKSNAPKMGFMPNKDEDPLRVLKLRLAKGEISKEEFLELRKMVEF